MQIEPVILCTIELVFALLFLFLYIYYPRAKEYLIFTLLTFLTVPIIYLNFTEDTLVNLVILRLLSLITIPLALYFLYTLFYQKAPKFLLYYIIGCSIMAAWLFFNPQISNSPYIQNLPSYR